MLIAEAQWIGRALQALPESAFPLINLGSSTEEFRTRSHPWVDDFVFKPLREAGLPVVHVDIKAAPGVDVVCDFMTADGRAAIAACNAGSILCSNLLEHLPQAAAASAEQITDLLKPQSFLLVTAPATYPHHADPIDNGYRPTPSELAGLFPGEVLSAEEVQCRRMAFYFADYGRRRARFALRLAAPVIRPKNWAHLASYSARRASASCVLLRVPA